MTTTKQALAQYYSNGTGGQQWCNQQLAKDMRTPAWQDDSVLKGITEVCFYYNTQAVHPDLVVNLCNAMGMPTVEKLLPFMQAAKDTGFDLTGMLKNLRPVLTKS